LPDNNKGNSNSKDTGNSKNNGTWCEFFYIPPIADETAMDGAPGIKAPVFRSF
jgi:hypothetical protein